MPTELVSLDEGIEDFLLCHEDGATEGFEGHAIFIKRDALAVEKLHSELCGWPVIRTCKLVGDKFPALQIVALFCRDLSGGTGASQQ